MGRVIIDGDSYLYSASLACSELVEISDGVYYESYVLNNARMYLMNCIDSFCSRCNANDYVLVVASNSNNFRKLINPKYKTNRKKQKKPIMLDKVREMVFKEFNCAYIPYLESDDVVRIMYEQGDNNYIVSIDKDLKTFPCTIYDTYHDTFSYVLPQQAENVFKRQLLMGDTCDGYTGIKGIGKATADKLLLDGITIDDIIQKYLDNDMTIEDFKRTYNCAKILGKDDYEDGVIKLYGGETLDVRDKS